MFSRTFKMPFNKSPHTHVSLIFFSTTSRSMEREKREERERKKNERERERFTSYYCPVIHVHMHIRSIHTHIHIDSLICIFCVIALQFLPLPTDLHGFFLILLSNSLGSLFFSICTLEKATVVRRSKEGRGDIHSAK